jgi:hypothetical protein
VPGLTKPIVHEDGDRIYIVGPLAPSTPTAQEVEEFAFSQALQQQAPNEHLAWFTGHYVSADVPNLNGVGWASGDLAIKALTPTFMPVNVMHDPRANVGVIADTRLLSPEKDNVPRAKIDTALAVWGHRFPEVVEEASANYAAGTLMQSMECLAPDYACSTCGIVFHKLPRGAERANWCPHLKSAEQDEDARISRSGAFRLLRNFTFTGTGLIFGTRGASGADPEAHLDTFTQEVAEFHQRVNRDKGTRKRSKRAMDEITIPKTEYDELRSRPTREELDEARNKLAEAESAVEQAEAAKVKAEGERDAEKAAKEQAEEKARRSELRDERMGELGQGFVAKLGDKTKGRLTDQAGTLTDDEWTARLEELEEAYDVKRDEGAPEGSGSGSGSRSEEFSREEVARSGASRAAGNGNGSTPSKEARRSVVGALMGGKK